MDTDIFARSGEHEFRRIEAQARARALAGEGRVISAGGGAVLSEDNRRLMRARARCVWLTAEPRELLARLEADGEGRLGVRMLPGQESFRILPLVQANAWALLPEAAEALDAGSLIEVYGLASDAIVLGENA